MKLTNNLRDAFVRAAMDDVPQIDYSIKAKKIIEDALNADFEAIFGKNIKRTDPAVMTWLYAGAFHFRHGVGPLWVRRPEKLGSAATKAKSRIETEICDLSVAQEEKRSDLEKKLKAIAYGCTTRKQLVAALPEFEKYMPPAVEKPSRLLPTISGVVTEFVKAGWPKNKTEQVMA